MVFYVNCDGCGFVQFILHASIFGSLLFKYAMQEY